MWPINASNQSQLTPKIKLSREHTRGILTWRLGYIDWNKIGLKSYLVFRHPVQASRSVFASANEISSMPTKDSLYLWNSFFSRGGLEYTASEPRSWGWICARLKSVGEFISCSGFSNGSRKTKASIIAELILKERSQQIQWTKQQSKHMQSATGSHY